MKKWEYVRLYLEFVDAEVGKVSLIISNGTRVFFDKAHPLNIHEYLNQLGKEGWEVINVFNASYHVDNIVYLKRSAD